MVRLPAADRPRCFYGGDGVEDGPWGWYFFFSSRRRHTRSYGDWSSDVCSSDLGFDGSKLWQLMQGACELLWVSVLPRSAPVWITGFGGFGVSGRCPSSVPGVCCRTVTTSAQSASVPYMMKLISCWICSSLSGPPSVVLHAGSEIAGGVFARPRSIVSVIRSVVDLSVVGSFLMFSYLNCGRFKGSPGKPAWFGSVLPRPVLP